MRHVNLAGKGAFFEVVAGTIRSQAASMVLQPGKSTGDAENRHEADQWLYVIEGQGTALVSGREVSLAPGTLLLIEAGEAHQIRNTGAGPLRTLDFYAPPAY